MQRRSFVSLVCGTASVGLAGCLGGEDAPSEPEPGEWFDGVPHYDGFEDHTGDREVTVLVGTGDNGFLFSPPAITVDPGTNVVFEWTGEGGDHNVESPGREWSSPYENAAGYSWEREFSSPGTHRYQCNPHRGVGMKGAVFVDATDG